MGDISNPAAIGNIISPSASTVPLTIKGAASQSADLQQWLDSNGTVFARVDSNGSFYSHASAAMCIGNTNSIGSYLGVVGANAATVVSIVRGAASQSADLQQWQNSSATVLAKVDNTGNIFGLGLGDIANSGTYVGLSSTDLTVNTRSATNKFVVKGAASQTANLQEWQNSGGTVQARVDNLGNILSGSIFTINTSVQGRFDNGYGIWFRETNQQSGADIYQFTGAGSLNASAIVQRYVGISPSINQSGTAGYTILLINPTETATGSGTKRLLDLQVGGTSQLSVNNQGVVNMGTTSGDATFQINGSLWFRSVGGGVGGIYFPASPFGITGSNIYFYPQGTSGIALTIKGVASQTGDLMQWQDSAAVVQARITAPGASANYGTLSVGTAPWDGSTTGKFVGSVNGTQIAVNAPSGYTGTLIDLQVAGAGKFNVTSSGWLTANVVQASSQLVTNNLWYGGGNPGIATTSTTIVLDARSGGGGATALTTIIRGGSSQGTNDLTQWQSSASAVLARVDASGNIIQSPGLYEGTLMATPTGLAVGALTTGGSLALSTTYYWVVTALDPFGGETVVSSQVTATTAGSGTLQTAPLSWTAVPGAMGYYVYRSTASGNFTNATRYTVINAVAFNDTGAAGTTATPPTATAAYTSKTSPASTVPNFLANTVTASANYGVLNIGSGPFDGVSTGKFAGNGNGTLIAANAVSGFTGNLIDLQVNGSSKFTVDNVPYVTVAASGALVVPQIRTNSGVSLVIYQTGNLSTAGPFISITPIGVALTGSSGQQVFASFAPTINASGTAGYTGLLVNATETATGSGTKNLLDLQVGGVSKCSVNNTGTLTLANVLNATNGMSVIAGVVAQTASSIAFKTRGAASQTADLFRTEDSATNPQFGVCNAGTGGSPVWALKIRAVANAESMGQTHTLGAYSGKAIQVLDDAGATVGWIPLYA